MAKQTFTAGQVLTAAQMNNLQTDIFNQTTSTKTANYSLVVGDRGTRVVGNGTSITFTVDNNIFTAGDTIKIHNINSTVLTIAAGAGVTINAAAGLTMSQWQEATLFATSASSFILFESTASSAQGLTLINTTSFSGVSSFSLPTDTFTSTYDYYRILLNITTASTTIGHTVRFRAAGSDSSAATYNYYNRNSSSSSGADTNTFARNQTSGVLFPVSLGTDLQTYVIDVMAPKLSQVTTLLFQGTGAVANHNYGVVAFNNTTSFDSLSVICSSGNFTGNYSVFGVNK